MFIKMNSIFFNNINNPIIIMFLKLPFTIAIINQYLGIPLPNPIIFS